LGKSATKFKTTNQVQEMLFEQKGVNWNDYSIREKRGGLCVKTDNGWKMVEMPHVVCEPENEFYKLIL
jgi:tRNA(His) 5'-end guanylyltransferase